MQFLANLGIDIKLLLAQMVNFGILLWLLAKFLYKPIIKRIEKDEKELKQAQIQKKELDREKEIFEQQKKREMAEAKQRAQETMKETENIAKEIKRNAHEEAKKEALAIIAQAKEKFQSQKPAFEREVVQNIRAKIDKNFGASFVKTVPLTSQKELQNIFFSDLSSRVHNLSLEKIEEADLVDLLKKTHLKEKGKWEYEREFEDSLAQKIGPVILESVFPLTQQQQKDLEKIISEKIGVKVKITTKQNKNLINGFRLEIMGIIVETNLSRILQDAIEFKPE